MGNEYVKSDWLERRRKRRREKWRNSQRNQKKTNKLGGVQFDGNGFSFRKTEMKRRQARLYSQRSSRRIQIEEDRVEPKKIVETTPEVPCGIIIAHVCTFIGGKGGGLWIHHDDAEEDEEGRRYRSGIFFLCVSSSFFLSPSSLFFFGRLRLRCAALRGDFTLATDQSICRIRVVAL